MSKKMPSKDEALEALDFIVNVLKEHEKDLDRLINELGNVTEQLGQTGELTGKVEKVEQKINGLQNEIGGLINYLSTAPKEPMSIPAPIFREPQRNDFTPGATMPNPPVASSVPISQGPPVILRCKQWEDFQNLAAQAQTISFLVKEPEKTFQADAIKSNQIITYSGEIPKPAALLKIWLAKQLDVSEKRILEGVLAIG
jgi:hypothetical protein